MILVITLIVAILALTIIGYWWRYHASVTELLPDPHYLRRQTVRKLCIAAGFREVAAYGNALAYTLNFIKAPGL
jgi:uncharacterized protein YneF (UPF0154 family)